MTVEREPGIDARRVPSAPAATAPGLLLLVGGGSVVAGSFLDWFGASSAGIAALSVSGTETSAGTIALLCGLAVAAVGLGLLVGAVRRTSGVVVVAATASLVIVVLAGIAAATARDRVTDAAVSREAGRLDGDRARAAEVVHRAFAASQLSIAIEAGLFLVVGGGLVSGAGAALAAASGRRLGRSGHGRDV
jgi:hypothetical protein